MQKESCGCVLVVGGGVVHVVEVEKAAVLVVVAKCRKLRGSFVAVVIAVIVRWLIPDATACCPQPERDFRIFGLSTMSSSCS